MSQSKKDLDEFYSKTDPWGYQDNSDDKFRKQAILDALSPFAPFKRALDIGAGEGWITKDLPAKKLEAYELSDLAAARMPNNIKRVTEPSGKYDLIIATGVFYEQYDHQAMLKLIEDHASDIVLTCNIKEWEINPLPSGRIIHCLEFPYRTYTQRMVIYRW